MKRGIESAKKYVRKIQSEHPIAVLEGLHDTICELFEGRVGKQYTADKLEVIYAIGKKRYAREVPPGYLDWKPSAPRYGDLVIWFQLIDQSKEAKKPLIFITEDRKDDWWSRTDGQTHGPRSELIQEFFNETGLSFYMYQADQVIEFAQRYLGLEKEQTTIEEIQEVRDENEARAALSALYESVAANAALNVAQVQAELAKRMGASVPVIAQVQSELIKRMSALYSGLADIIAVAPSSTLSAPADTVQSSPDQSVEPQDEKDGLLRALILF